MRMRTEQTQPNRRQPAPSPPFPAGTESVYWLLVQAILAQVEDELAEIEADDQEER